MPRLTLARQRPVPKALETVTPAPSSSVMFTVVVVVVPRLTPPGSGVVPKASSTLLPPSSTSSWVAVKVIVCDMSPVLKVTFAGTPE